MYSFFVFGLPRSRTAWLSVFLSQSGVFCHHDGINGCSSTDEYQEKIKGCGDSTTGFFAIDYDSLYQSSNRVIIEKSYSEIERCIEWCDSTYLTNSRDEILRQNDILMGIDGLRVKQSDINNSLPLIFEHLTEQDWNERYSIITNLNVQSDPYGIDTEAAKRFFSASIQ